MTTAARAAEIISRAMLAPSFKAPESRAFTAAVALAKAGLLAPDLPEANDTNLPNPIKIWVLDAEGHPIVWSAPGCSVMIQRIEPGDLTPSQARTFALNILAAVDYAEGELDAVD